MWATMMPMVAKTFGASRPKAMNRQPAVLRSLSLREAVIPISSRNRQSTPWNSLTKKLSSARVTSWPLQAADEADDDPAEEQVEPGVEEDLVEQLAG